MLVVINCEVDFFFLKCVRVVCVWDDTEILYPFQTPEKAQGVLLAFCISCPWPILDLGLNLHANVWFWISSKLEMATLEYMLWIWTFVLGKESCMINSRFRIKCSFWFCLQTIRNLDLVVKNFKWRNMTAKKQCNNMSVEHFEDEKLYIL